MKDRFGRHREDYFKSEGHRYLFALLEMEGKSRWGFLDAGYGCTRLVHDEEFRNSWYVRISKVIHPDVFDHPRAKDGMLELTKLLRELSP